jgi:hypothetical protein
MPPSDGQVASRTSRAPRMSRLTDCGARARNVHCGAPNENGPPCPR